MLLPLSEPVTEGVLLTTLILYPEPAVVFDGIVAGIVPDEVADRVPILTGLAKLPLALLSCAVKTFPDVNVPAKL